MRNSWLSQVFEKGKSLLGLSRDNLRVRRARRTPVRTVGSSGDPVDQWNEGLIPGSASDCGASVMDVPEMLDAAVDLEAALLNQAISNYEILETLDRGGQGTVYRAVQRSTGRQVALKVLHPDAGSSRRRRQRFAREVELVAGLRHPNVVTIFDSGVAAGRPYLSMELIDGLPIDDYVLLHRPTVRECVAIFEKICRAVASVHQRGVIHRDLKPGNILVDMEKEPHILDFGLAKRCDDEPGRRGLSVTGQVVGTLPFLSPEQIDGGNGGVDIRTDIHALGVILHLLLTGEMPYAVDGPRAEVAENIVECVPAPLDRRAAEAGDSGAVGAISKDLSHIVLKALAKEKARRYQSADALADDLQRYLIGDVVTARGDGAWQWARVALRKYRIHSAVAAAFVMLLVGWGVSTTALWRSSDRLARDARDSLAMGRSARGGGIARDQRRLNDAIRFNEQIIEIFGKIRNPTVEDHRFHYGAHHDLAQIYFDLAGKDDLCKFHCDRAVQIAQFLIESNPGEFEYCRLSAFSNRLKGRFELKSKAWVHAQQSFSKSAELFRSLPRSGDPFDDAPLDFEAEFSNQYLAMALDKKGDRDRAIYTLRNVQRAMLVVCTHYPGNFDYLIELARTEALLAAVLLKPKIHLLDKESLLTLTSAENRLVDAISNGLAKPRIFDADTLLQVIRTNKALATRRIQRTRE